MKSCEKSQHRSYLASVHQLSKVVKLRLAAAPPKLAIGLKYQRKQERWCLLKLTFLIVRLEPLEVSFIGRRNYVCWLSWRTAQLKILERCAAYYLEAFP